jgi:hypothetical protein
MIWLAHLLSFYGIPLSAATVRQPAQPPVTAADNSSNNAKPAIELPVNQLLAYCSLPR